MNVHADGALFWEPGLERFAGREVVFPGAREGSVPPANAVPVAIIDSGIARGHPQLAGHVVDAVDFTGEGPDDVLGHGTALALMGVFGEGGARVKVLSAKVVPKSGAVREQAVLQAIDWAVRRGAAAVHISVGFQGVRSQYKILCESIARHWNVVFFAAVGNFSPPREQYPANCRLGNLHPVWADPAQPRAHDLVAK